MTHRKRSVWLSLGRLPIASSFLISGLGCSPRVDVAESATNGSGGNSGSAGDGSMGGDVATGGTNTGGSAGSAGEAVGGSSGTGGTAGIDPNCATGNGFLCAKDLHGFPFVAFAISYSYSAIFSEGTPPAGETTVTMTHPDPGRLCLSGNVASDELGAGFNLHFSRRNQLGTQVLGTFDAESLGITQFAVTIESPSNAGVSLGLFTVKQHDCPTGPLDCNHSFGHADLDVGAVTVPFNEFTTADPRVPLDLSVLDALVFQVQVSGDYDFCIRDFKLLDAEGAEVRPE